MDLGIAHKKEASMLKQAAIPHDATDLQLAPVALEVDRWLGDLADLSIDEIDLKLVLNTNRQTYDAADRREVLVGAIIHDVETRGWELSLHERGLRLTHEDRVLVLGLPPSVTEYLGD
jgi:hypothetical protein